LELMLGRPSTTPNFFRRDLHGEDSPKCCLLYYHTLH
jgi:hypothetical protein